MSAYYNEFDPYAAQWLRNLIAAGHIAPGDVDERSIVDVQPADLKGYVQCHFFAGIGGWSHALRLAMWPDDRPVWTGSCPCQPFSGAGKRKGAEDARHLWPELRRLVSECNPPIVFGEQVASKDGRVWLTGVRSDLEALGYAVGAADLCAAGVGAPHIRQRLWWVADAGHKQERRSANSRKEESGRPFSDIAGCGASGGLADSLRPRSLSGSHAGIYSGEESARSWNGEPERRGSTGGVDDAISQRGRSGPAGQQDAGDAGQSGQIGWGSHTIGCADGKARRIEPGSFPLAHGVPNRVGRLRGYGNAIVPQVAAEFIGAFCDLSVDNVGLAT